MNDIPNYLLCREGKLLGEVRGTRRCRLAGCTGIQLVVRWPDGKRTYNCTKATKPTSRASTWQLV